jgi:DNA-directed RNA polymerase specialized sigma24 family protein
VQDRPEAGPSADARRRKGRGVPPPGAPQVESWLHRLVAGDADAAAWLYDTFGPPLFRRLRLRYGYPGGLDAQDLLHDAFVYFFQERCGALRRILERVPPDELTSDVLERHLWDAACGVASNRRRSAARRRGTGRTDGSELAEDPLAERDAISRDLLERLDGCVRGAPDRVYLYFKLRYWDGLSPREISAVTGWPAQVTYRLKEALGPVVSQCAERLGVRLP